MLSLGGRIILTFAQFTDLLAFPAVAWPKLHHFLGDAGLADFDRDPEIGDGGAAADGAGFGVENGIGFGGPGAGDFGDVIRESVAGGAAGNGESGITGGAGFAAGFGFGLANEGGALFDEFDEDFGAVKGVIESEAAIDKRRIGWAIGAVFIDAPAGREELAELVFGEGDPIFGKVVGVIAVVIADGVEPGGFVVPPDNDAIVRDDETEFIGRTDVGGL